jgi:hypothetical protein
VTYGGETIPVVERRVRGGQLKMPHNIEIAEN